VRAAAGRLVTIAIAAGCAMAFACPAAAAASGKVRLARSAWFVTTTTNQVGAPVSSPVAEPTGVPKGDDAVSFTEDQSGASSKETLLQFALPHAAAASTVTKFTLTAQLDASPTAPQAGARGAPVVACLPTRDWIAGESQDSSGQPPVDCAHAVAGVWKNDTVTFEISRLAQSWVDDTNLGVALVNDPKNKTQPFQAVLSGGTHIEATMSYTPNASSPPPPPPHHHTTSQQPKGIQNHQSTQPPTGGRPSFPTASVPSGGGTATVGQGPADGRAPVVANPGSGAGAARSTAGQAAATSRDSSSLPPKGFWVATAAVVIMLVGASLALEDQHRHRPTSTSRSRLDLLLRDPARVAAFTTRSTP
jgi:hypothetical protein